MPGSINRSANSNSFNAEFIDLITRHAWGEIWTGRISTSDPARAGDRHHGRALGQWMNPPSRPRRRSRGGSLRRHQGILFEQAIIAACPRANHAGKEASAIIRNWIAERVSVSGCAAITDPRLKRRFDQQ